MSYDPPLHVTPVFLCNALLICWAAISVVIIVPHLRSFFAAVAILIFAVIFIRDIKKELF